MIIKSFELEKLKSSKSKFHLIYGNNEGIKQDIINNYYVNNFDGEVLKFGDVNEKLKARIEIKHPSLNYNLIRNGSIGLAESYMQGYFETDNLSNLIEITAKNIKLIYKFSGILDLSAINFLKNKIWNYKIKIFKEYKLSEAKQAHQDLESRKLTGPAILIP